MSTEAIAVGLFDLPLGSSRPVQLDRDALFSVPSAVVYLCKQGACYPFVPLPDANVADPRRDSVLELRVRDSFSAEVRVEKDLHRWLALWDAPGL